MADSDNINTAISSLASTIASAPDAPKSYSMDGQSVSRDRAGDLEKLLKLKQLMSGPFEVTHEGA